MARFDVFNNPNGNGLLLDVQSDLLGNLNTRAVVPLLLESDSPNPAQRLNPEFSIKARRYVMATQFIAAVPERELKSKVASLDGEAQEISAALDMLFVGF